MDSNSPIPAFVLIHNIQVEETHNKNSPATGIYDNSQTIQHEINRVRVQPVNKRELSSETPAIQGSNYMLFIDRVNSINQDNYLPKIDDTIIFDGQKHGVTQIAAVYALEKQPHHWEVLLT
ncbi:MAG: putative minor capsid protein [Lactobacillaceae bacterium]|nr:hypothetical protein [Bombilactobacillus mellis]